MGLRHALAVVLALVPALAVAADETSAFHGANDAVRAGDLPKGIAGYRALASAGVESASLYWNWAQAAGARGESAEALWALLRAREIEPGDGAVSREVERLREQANLDPAEIAPAPLAALDRMSRRFHLPLAAILLLIASLVLHVLARRALSPGRLAFWAAAAVICGLLLSAAPLVGALSTPTAVVVRRGTPLLDAASTTANSIGTLRQGEVVVLLAESDGYLRVEDSSGARGWASTEQVWRLDRTPAPDAAR